MLGAKPVWQAELAQSFLFWCFSWFPITRLFSKAATPELTGHCQLARSSTVSSQVELGMFQRLRDSFSARSLYCFVLGLPRGRFPVFSSL